MRAEEEENKTGFGERERERERERVLLRRGAREPDREPSRSFTSPRGPSVSSLLRRRTPLIGHGAGDPLAGRAWRRGGGRGAEVEVEEEEVFDDAFDIPHKNAPHDRLRRWRQAALVLNASRRFRYTLDLKKEEEKEMIRRKIRSHAQVYGQHFFSKKLVRRISMVQWYNVATASHSFPIEPEKLTTLNRDHSNVLLQEVGGVRGLSDLLKSNLDRGINPNEDELLQRRNIYGMPRFDSCHSNGSCRHISDVGYDNRDEGWYDGGSIFLAVFLVILVTAISDYRQSLQFRHLNEEKQNIQVEVVRGGKRSGASIFDLVVGDVVPLKIGDQVPADGILISGHSLAIDESSMTGESKIVHKDQKAPFLMSGCKVADGYGSMLVTGVGTNTEWGQLMANLSEDNGEETPLQVTIVVVAVPEGLPLAVTLTLAYSMKKMMRDKALVRRLSSCETMGSATTICSDKTGTLTLNKMTVVEAYFGGTKLDPCHDTSQMSASTSSLIIEGIAQNTTGTVFLPEDGGEAELTGSPTEKAILSWGLKVGMDFHDVRSKSSVLHVFPFNSEKKRGAVAVQAENGVHIHWKGAAEIVLASCKSWLSVEGLVHPMSTAKYDEYQKSIEGMAANHCAAEMIPEEDIANWKLPEDDLTLLGIVGIKDPCRPGVRDAVRLCTSAGVKVRMVTGDNIETAKAIALECGILDANSVISEPFVIEGKVFREMSEIARGEVADKILVMGRSSPNDKLLLVQALKRKGHVVAVTGDGTNDAPALHEADIGLSMGISGTEVAKESSDIIILDDDFTSVVKVVRWGRSVYANIQKFIQFQLTVNVAALVINVVAAVSSGD
ncbi:hypothetical protein EJB05_48192, partial [Eragrostis curvula]